MGHTINKFWHISRADFTLSVWAVEHPYGRENMLILCLLFILFPYETYFKFPGRGTGIQPIKQSPNQQITKSFFPTGFT